MVDNAGFFSLGEDPPAQGDAEPYEQLTDEFPQWLSSARAAGITG